MIKIENIQSVIYPMSSPPIQAGRALRGKCKGRAKRLGLWGVGVASEDVTAVYLANRVICIASKPAPIVSVQAYPNADQHGRGH